MYGALDFSEWLFRLMMSSRLGVFRGFQWNWCFVSASGGRGGCVMGNGRAPVEFEEQDAVAHVLLSLSAVKSPGLAGTGREVLLAPDKTLLTL